MADGDEIMDCSSCERYMLDTCKGMSKKSVGTIISIIICVVMLAGIIGLCLSLGMHNAMMTLCSAIAIVIGAISMIIYDIMGL